MGETINTENLVLDAMRLAERAHRTRPQGPHHRKNPEGEDRPAYFIHLAQVGWMLQDAGLLDKGHPANVFTKQDHATQLDKFESLYEQVFKSRGPEKLAARYKK